MATILEIRNLYKRFEPGPWVIEGFDLAVQAGALMYVLGPSGCGKTTLLRLVAGFESPDAGEIVKDGEAISRPGRVVPPEQRRIGMVFQDYALFPHLTVGENVAFGLPRSGRSARGERVGQILDLVGLAELADRYPHELSGGQQQRVALARALARQPHLVLLDEPFSNLDVSLRQRIREEMRTVLRRAGATALLVTHDQEEAINLADRIAVMNEGRLQQVGTPEEILHRPCNRFVASFLGPSDFIPGTVNGSVVETELGALALPPDLLAPSGTQVEVQLRPDHFQACEDGEGTEAHVVGREFQGVSTVYKLALPSGTRVQATLPGHMELSPGDRVRVRFLPPQLVCFPLSRS